MDEVDKVTASHTGEKGEGVFSQKGEPHCIGSTVWACVCTVPAATATVAHV